MPEFQGPLPARNPALFPQFVAQHSVRFDPADSTDLAGQFPGIELPPQLARAVRKRQIEFLAGRLCARRALAECAPEVAGESIAIGLQREPVWPPGIVGAITHAAGFASVAVARKKRARGIGLDAERTISDEKLDEIVSMIAGPDELSEVAQATGWSSATALTVIFSAKETIYKCLYPEVQRYFDFMDARIDGIEAGSFRARLLVELTPALPAGHPLEGRIELVDDFVYTAMVVAA